MKKVTAQVKEGLATLGQDSLEILRRLDDVLLTRAQYCGATEQSYPPLNTVSDLERIDYFVNFPHLGLAVAPLLADGLAATHQQDSSCSELLSPDVMCDSRFCLPSAACYPVYRQFKDRTLAGPQQITTVQKCFRNEVQYEGLQRLLAFTMREFVMLGESEEVHRFIESNTRWTQRFAEGAELSLEQCVAADPFFEADGSRARMQLLFPVKHEFVYDGSVAVASTNFHRNFFGERWGIRLQDGEHAYSGCVAFGLERWLYAFSRRYDGDKESILAAIGAGDALGREVDRTTTSTAADSSHDTRRT